MGERMRPRLRVLLDRKEIRRSKSSTDHVIRELDGATGDLEAAKRSLKTGDYKWATIQAYQSMLHAARALLNRMGFREQSHQGLLAALREFYEREIVNKMLREFSEAMTLTEQLHDGLMSSEDSAKRILQNAVDFLEQTARILAAPPEWFERPAPQRRSKKRKR
jgi:uncharacterized protein (UPF0332 family)